jgi:TatA/E family protein of Tat protein translocase
MVSVSLAEILTIALIVLIVFGPRRLPELSRRAGRLLRDLRAATAELRAGLEAERAEAESALDDVRRAFGPTVDDEHRSADGDGEQT